MKKMKRLAAVLLAGLMILGCVTGCSKQAETTAPEAAETEASGLGLANPYHEGLTEEEVAEATGLDLQAPEGAENVAYAYIDGSDEAEPIAEMNFSLDGHDYCYRAQGTALTSIDVELGADATPVEIEEAVAQLGDTCAAISGMYDEWDCSATIVIGECSGICSWNEGKAGYVVWLDAVPGVLYSLSMEKGTEQMLLLDTAAAVYVPTQGED